MYICKMYATIAKNKNSNNLKLQNYERKSRKMD